MKKRLLAIVMVLTLMTMGVAYAAWSHSVTVSGEIATGELKMVIHPEENIPFNSEQQWQYNNTATGGTYDRVSTTERVGDNYNYFGYRSYQTFTSSKSHPGDFNYVISFTGENFYPGANGYFRFLIKNEGTIPTKIHISEDDQEVIVDGNSYVINSHTDMAYTFYRCNNYSFDLIGPQMDNSRDTMNELLANEEFMPGEEITVVVEFFTDIEANESLMNEESEYIIQLPLLIEQYNKVD